MYFENFIMIVLPDNKSTYASLYGYWKSILLFKAKRQYLLTLQGRRYRFLLFQSSIKYFN